MRAVVVQYAIGRFKTWTGLDCIVGSPKGDNCVSKDGIGFPKEIFGSSKEVSPIRKGSPDDARGPIRGVSLHKSLHYGRPTKSNISVQRWFFWKNSEPAVNQPKEVFSRKHRAHCLKAMPGY